MDKSKVPRFYEPHCTYSTNMFQVINSSD